jgi:hypothetical protein
MHYKFMKVASLHMYSSFSPPTTVYPPPPPRVFFLLRGALALVCYGSGPIGGNLVHCGSVGAVIFADNNNNKFADMHGCVSVYL